MGPTLNRIERCSQLVREGCEKFVLDMTQPLGFGARRALGGQKMLSFGSKRGSSVSRCARARSAARRAVTSCAILATPMTLPRRSKTGDMVRRHVELRAVLVQPRCLEPLDSLTPP